MLDSSHHCFLNFFLFFFVLFFLEGGVQRFFLLVFFVVFPLDGLAVAGPGPLFPETLDVLKLQKREVKWLVVVSYLARNRSIRTSLKDGLLAFNVLVSINKVVSVIEGHLERIHFD